MNQALDQVLFWTPGPSPKPTQLKPRDHLLRLTAPSAQPRQGHCAEVPRVDHRPATPGIDHRQARRLGVQIPVLLRFCHNQCAFGVARNLSRDGVFVETAATPDLNCCLDLMVPGLSLADAAPALFPTQLIHRTDRGLGLMFRALSQGTAAALERLLWEAQSALRESRPRGPGLAQ